MATYTCDSCHQSFTTDTSANPGVTYVSDFDGNPTKVLVLYLCDADVPKFYATDAETQQAFASAVNRTTP